MLFEVMFRAEHECRCVGCESLADDVIEAPSPN